ncbi:ribosome maturation factor RimM [Gaoshiqia sp. Z1-71]|uniref:ribosome maturation factor RimM n=1 Tax=Gaoshiqia hydrogeniformans TaxID=3290090 RepID=UPI003BF7C658
METIRKDDCLKIGYLQKTHGVRGELVLILDPGFADSLEEEPTLFLEIDGLLVPFFLKADGVRFRSNESALLQFDWVDDENQARRLIGLPVFIGKDDWLNEEEDVLFHQLVGYKFFDSKLGFIGLIEQVDDYSGNLIFQLDYKGKEVLVPFSDDFLIRFDEENQEIELDCPDGIFDLN